MKESKKLQRPSCLDFFFLTKHQILIYWKLFKMDMFIHFLYGLKAQVWFTLHIINCLREFTEGEFTYVNFETFFSISNL